MNVSSWRSYNRVNGTYACEEPVSLGNLKSRMGFDGWVVRCGSTCLSSWWIVRYPPSPDDLTPVTGAPLTLLSPPRSLGLTKKCPTVNSLGRLLLQPSQMAPFPQPASMIWSRVCSFPCTRSTSSPTATPPRRGTSRRLRGRLRIMLLLCSLLNSLLPFSCVGVSEMNIGMTRERHHAHVPLNR